MKEWCADNIIRRTSAVPEDAKANGSAEAASRTHQEASKSSVAGIRP
jgi:hypothetical protein